MTLAQAKATTAQPQGAISPAEAPAPRRRQLSPTTIVTLVAFLVLVTAMGHVAQRAKVAALAHDLHVERLRLAEMERVKTHLQVEVERARSLERVEYEAKNRLGMVAPTRTTWVVMDTKREEDVVRPANEGERGLGFVAALSGWFERVRSEIKAALPRSEN